jgi:hypothetical protein
VTGASGDSLNCDSSRATVSATATSRVPEIPGTDDGFAEEATQGDLPLTEAGARAAAQRLLDYLITGARRTQGPNLDSLWAGGLEIMTGFVKRHGLADSWRIARVAVEDLGCRISAGPGDMQVTIRQFTPDNDPAFAAVILEFLQDREPAGV